MSKVLAEPRIDVFKLRDNSSTSKNAQNTVDKNSGGISLLAKEDKLFSNAKISEFSLHEQLSQSFSASIAFFTLTEFDLHSLNLDELLVRVTYGVKNSTVLGANNPAADPVSDLLAEKYYLWGKISEIVFRGSKKFSSGNTQEIRYFYELKLSSPLEKLSSCFSWNFFFDRSLEYILNTLLTGKNGVLSEGVGSFFKLDLSALKDIERFKFSKLLLQQGPQSDLDFFNRLLIDNGINYVFDQRQDDCALVFSDTLAFTNLWKNADTQEKEKFCNQHLEGHFAQEKAQTGNLLVDDFCCYKRHFDSRNDEGIISGLFYEEDAASRNASYSLIEKQKERNVERRRQRIKEGCSWKLYNQVVVRPGCVFTLKGEGSKADRFFVVSSSELKINSSLYTNPASVLVEGIKISGEIDGLRLGSFASRPFNNSVYSTSELLAATVCDQDGNCDNQTVTTFDENQCLGQDLFYAKLDLSGHVVVAHAGKDRLGSGKNPRCGNLVMLLRSGGNFYLQALSNQALLPDSEKSLEYGRELASETVFDSDDCDNLFVDLKQRGITGNSGRYGGRADMRLGRFINNTQYVASLIATGEPELNRFIYELSVQRNKSNLYDDIYLSKFQTDAREKSKAYRENKRNYEKVLRNFRQKARELNIGEADPEISADDQTSQFKHKIDELRQQTQYSIATVTQNKEGKNENSYVSVTLDAIEKSFKKAESELYELAGKIVEEYKIDVVKEGSRLSGRSELSLLSSDAMSINAEGDLTIHAKNINIIADGKVCTHAKGDITEYSAKSITQNVGGSSIALKVDGTSIFSPAAYSGQNVSEVYRNSSLLGSSFNVKSYSGVSASAFNVNLSATNYLQLSGSIGAGIRLGYGAVSMTGGKVDINTSGTRDMAVGIAKFTANFIADLTTSLAAKDKNAVAIKDAVLSTSYTVFDDVLSGIKSSRGLNGAKSKLDKNTETIRNIEAIDEANRTAEQKAQLASEQQKRGELYFNYVMAIIAMINYTLDRIYDVCKVVYTSMKIDADRKNIKGSDRNRYLTPFKDSSMSKLDQIRLYITYEKTLCSLISAGYIAHKGAKGFLKPSLASLSLTSTSVKLEGDSMTFTSKQNDFLQTYLAGSGAATIRNVVQQGGQQPQQGAQPQAGGQPQQGAQPQAGGQPQQGAQPQAGGQQPQQGGNP